ncbi:PHD finger protein 10-like [Oopsacas minuta]|uniref:PHD finger protein 10-like n=1 Tax=Oopsacas minuta TaxID=111878 RepID=A0AAV7KEE9_9METZ|nr:PHD finger protein 10-like [Oopsacas minuta]
MSKSLINSFKLLNLPTQKIIEYRWPNEDPFAESYLLQEQIAEYLGVRAFQRRFPSLSRRNVDFEERDFLQGTDALGDMNTLLGLVALRCIEILELMRTEFPTKYIEFSNALEVNTINQLLSTHNAHYANTSKKLQSTDIEFLRRKAILSATDYNSILNQERHDSHSTYFDANTNVLLVPNERKPYPIDSPKVMNRYPLALMPGQYQHTYPSYSPRQLRSLPVDTVLELPPCSKKPKIVFPKSIQNVVPDIPVAVEVVKDSPIEEVIEKPIEVFSKNEILNDINKVPLKRPSSVICIVCLRQSSSGKGLEEFIHCSQCPTTAHFSCLNLEEEALEKVKTYKWQCLGCKTCTICAKASDEDKMVLCYSCDRGYHTFCLKIPCVPCGVWVCGLCVTCNNCNCPDPSGIFNQEIIETDRLFKWHHIFSELRGNEDHTTEFLQTICEKCFAVFDHGNFCPICLTTYHEDDSDILMACCDECERWIHKDCDEIDDKTYEDLSRQIGNYICSLCKGFKTERYDRFHKKHNVTTISNT